MYKSTQNVCGKKSNVNSNVCGKNVVGKKSLEVFSKENQNLKKCGVFRLKIRLNIIENFLNNM